MQEAYLRQIKTAIRDQAFDFASESVLRHRGRRRGQAAQGPTPGDDTRLGWTLVSGGQRVHCVRGPHASLVKADNPELAPNPRCQNTHELWRCQHAHRALRVFPSPFHGFEEWMGGVTSIH